MNAEQTWVDVALQAHHDRQRRIADGRETPRERARHEEFERNHRAIIGYEQDRSIYRDGAKVTNVTRSSITSV
jgi:hypothetical protein